MTNIFKGSGVALVTPFNQDMQIDFDALASLVRDRKLEDFNLGLLKTTNDGDGELARLVADCICFPWVGR